MTTLVSDLERKRARDLIVTRVEAIGGLADAEDDRIRLFRKYSEKYSDIAKIEIVCADDEVQGFVTVLRKASYTGERGDGRIFVFNIERAINIRTDEDGDNAL